MFCLAACINIAGAVYYSNLQFARTTAALEDSPLIYKAETVVDLAQRSVRELDKLLQATFSQQGIEPDQHDMIKVLAHVIRSDAVRLGELAFVFEDVDMVARARRLLEDHQALVLDYLADPSHATDRDFATMKQAHQQQHRAVKAQLSVLQRALLKLAGGDANLARNAVAMYYILLAVVLLEMLVLMITFSFFRKWMLRPIHAIRGATEQIAAGNLDFRLEETGTDELGILIREVNHMAGALSVAQKQLKQKERMAAMGEMVSVVAHNIRNPVAGIRATAQTCLHDFDPSSEAYRQQKRIIQAVDSLEQWLKELVHLNRPIKLQLELTSLDQLVGELEHIFQPLGRRKNVDIRYAPEQPKQTIAIDRQHFIQAMASILDNAIESAPAGSCVDIHAGPCAENRASFFIEIADHGQGVPEKLRSRIFEPYFSTKLGGTGIGLSMARKIVEAHSGQLTVQDTNGSEGLGGATFRIEIPHTDKTPAGDRPDG